MHSNLLKLYYRRIQHNTHMTNIIKDTQICIYNIYLATETVKPTRARQPVATYDQTVE